VSLNFTNYFNRILRNGSWTTYEHSVAGSSLYRQGQGSHAQTIQFSPFVDIPYDGRGEKIPGRKSQIPVQCDDMLSAVEAESANCLSPNDTAVRETRFQALCVQERLPSWRHSFLIQFKFEKCATSARQVVALRLARIQRRFAIHEAMFMEKHGVINDVSSERTKARSITRPL